MDNDDYAAYLKIMTECCLGHGVDVWAYCLMPDHVHLIAVPREKHSLSICLRAAQGNMSGDRKIGSGAVHRRIL